MALLKKPIILFCSERSGSNLITKIFDAHTEICAPGDAHLFKVMSECSDRYPRGSDKLRQAVLTLFEAKVSKWQLDRLSTEQRFEIIQHLADSGAMAAALYDAEAKLSGKSHAMIKENSVFSYLWMILAQSVSPRVLFMVRDPRDMALSWKNGPVMRGGVIRAMERWLYDQKGYLKALSILPTKVTVSFLRYEDLLKSPEEELRRACLELGLNFEHQMLSFDQYSSSAKNDAQQSSMWSNLDKPLLKKNYGKFVDELSEEEVAFIENKTGELMQVMGYEKLRNDDHPFCRFDSFENLLSHIRECEPYDKPSYLNLPKKERERFEAWSKLREEMYALPVLRP